MSVDLAWFFYRVQPRETSEIKYAFEKAVEQSQIVEKSQAFLREWPETPEDAEEWDRWVRAAYGVLYPDAFTKLLEDISIEQTVLSSESNFLDLVCTNRVGATMMLCGGLGFARAARLPGYFGNLFVPPKETAIAVAQVEQIFAEVDSAEFIDRAMAIGLFGNGNDGDAQALATWLQLQLRRVLDEGNGLLALIHPCVGAMPYLEDDREYDEE